MEEAKKQAIERHLNAVRIKLGHVSRSAQDKKPVQNEKPTQTEKPIKIEKPAQVVRHVKIEKTAEVVEPALTTTDIKEEAKPAVSLMNLPRSNDAKASAFLAPKNHYAGLRASKKRKLPELSPSPPAHDLSDHQEANNDESNPATTYIKEENVQPNRKSSSGRNSTIPPEAKDQEIKSQQRPFAPPKKQANKKANNRTM